MEEGGGGGKQLFYVYLLKQAMLLCYDCKGAVLLVNDSFGHI